MFLKRNEGFRCASCLDSLKHFIYWLPFRTPNAYVSKTVCSKAHKISSIHKHIPIFQNSAGNAFLLKGRLDESVTVFVVRLSFNDSFLKTQHLPRKRLILIFSKIVHLSSVVVSISIHVVDSYFCRPKTHQLHRGQIQAQLSPSKPIISVLSNQQNT